MVTVLNKGASRKKIKDAFIKLQKSLRIKGVDAHKYCGSITLKEDPLNYQRRVRDEWQ